VKAKNKLCGRPIKQKEKSCPKAGFFYIVVIHFLISLMVCPEIFFAMVWKGDNDGITQMQLHVRSAAGA
jgi:hypothetical protein